MAVEDDASRNIPAAIKREVRQQCGFGCVICGNPIIQYHHINPWAEVREHTADNIVAVCPTHHTETIGMTKELVREFKASPINLKFGQTSPKLLRITSNEFVVTMGTVTYETQFSERLPVTIPVILDDAPMIIVKRIESLTLLSLAVYSEQNQPLLIIQDNEIVHSTEVWDSQFVGNKVTLHGARSKKIIEFTYHPDQPGLSISRGEFFFNNWKVIIHASGDLEFSHPVAGTRTFAECFIGNTVIALNLGKSLRFENWPTAVRVL
jgi:hypothetical protein